MTFVSLIALAFGMMAAAAEAAVPRPAFAAIRLERRSRAIRRAVAAGSARTQQRERVSKPRFVTAPFRRLLAPLTGAASPRAPAANC